jgi:proline iminopeptidase
MELSLMVLDESFRAPSFEDFDPSGGLIEMKYTENNWFIDENYIVKNAKKLTMPVNIIQGRYDMLCRPANAYRLQQVLPNCRLIWAIGGHSKQHEAFNIQSILIRQQSL